MSPDASDKAGAAAFQSLRAGEGLVALRVSDLTLGPKFSVFRTELAPATKTSPATRGEGGSTMAAALEANEREARRAARLRGMRL